MNGRILEALEGVGLLGFVAVVLAFVFPIHDRLYAWPLPAVAAFAWAVLFALVVAFRLIVGPRQIVVEVSL